ncbi:putative nuclease [Tribonema minus]|uniref:Putative nuclease n=1 Tax=Tribonema minus TaxID=303371 RepID=A0A836CPX4_9STRA|nr:putative nuclease [Tribonema minus]
MLLRKLSALVCGSHNGIDWQDVTYDSCEKYLPAHDGDIAKVIRVIDGDTVHLALKNNGNFVRLSCRLQGIDTAEMRSKDSDEKDLAERAKSVLAGACDNKLVTLSNVSLEKYGRLLADLTVVGSDVTLSQVMLNLPELCHAYDGGKKTSFT